MQKVHYLNYTNEQPAEIKCKVTLLINCNKVHALAIRKKKWNMSSVNERPNTAADNWEVFILYKMRSTHIIEKLETFNSNDKTDNTEITESHTQYKQTLE